jgi:exodeoxyribonuclease VII large subunit
VQVQGKSASSEIAAAIEVANRFFKNDIEVLIVGRGGGSVEDLWAFNEEIVARAIYSSEIPIISAVGHEVDWTIADYVADMRAPTPTAAAEMLLKEIINQNRTLHLIQERLLQTLFHRFQILQQRIENTKSTLSIARLESRLQSTKQRLRNSVSRSEIILTNRLESLRFSLDKAHNNLLSLHRRRLSNTLAKLTLLHEKLAHLNPHNILNKGYSLTYYETPQGEKLLRSSHEVRPHTKLRTVLSSGEVQSSVITTPSKTEKIHPNETA